MRGYLILILMSTAGVTLTKVSNEIMKEDFTIPYMVYLQSSTEPCIGSLIHPQWVLTAAHCPLPIKIRLGVYQPSITNKKEQVRNSSLIVTHPEYDAQFLKNDLRMIKLSKAAELNTHVGTVAIAIEPLIFNESCFIPTWTWNDYRNNSDPDILTWINQYPLPSHTCVNLLHQQEKAVANIMCVGQPLNILSNIKEVPAAPAICSGRLHGILSWGKKGITLGNEGFYTQIHAYARWIMKIMNSH